MEFITILANSILISRAAPQSGAAVACAGLEGLKRSTDWIGRQLQYLGLPFALELSTLTVDGCHLCNARLIGRTKPDSHCRWATQTLWTEFFLHRFRMNTNMYCTITDPLLHLSVQQQYLIMLITCVWRSCSTDALLMHNEPRSTFI